MFIELTDHLRCPADHEESYLVLLPDEMQERSVRDGRLGCPVCGRTYEVTEGVLDLGGGDTALPETTLLTPEASDGARGAERPGRLHGAGGKAGGGLARGGGAQPGVGLVAVNPPAEVEDEPGISVLRSGLLPLKSRSMRGVVLGSPFGGDPRWVERSRAGGAAGAAGGG